MGLLDRIIEAFSSYKKTLSSSNIKVTTVYPNNNGVNHSNCIDRMVNYNNKDPETLLKLVPQNSYAMLLSAYYEKYYGFYSFFKEKVESRSLMPLGAYADNFYDWFRGVMAEKENAILASGIIDNSNKIKGTIIEETLDDYKYICENHLSNYYRNAFDLLNRCKNMEDYHIFYSLWKESIEKAELDGRAHFYEYIEALEPCESDYIPVKMFLDYVNINNYLTPVGEAYSDEIQDLICDALEQEYKDSNENFFFKYGNTKFLEGFTLIDTLCLYWPNNIEGIAFSRSTAPIGRRMQPGTVDSKETRKLIKECENIIRQKENLPLIGEGWISETVLFKQIEAIFEKEIVEKHASPLFLGKQHYDVYFPNYRIALEYQGVQHFEPIDIFGGTDGLKRTQERDRRKKELSIMNGVALIEVMPDYDIEELVHEICDIAHCNNPLNESILQESCEIAIKTREELKVNKKRLQSISKKKVKQYTPEEKQAAQNKLLSIKTRFNEGYWVKLWYIEYQISNADLLDLAPKDIDRIIENLKKELPKIGEQDRKSSGDAFKRAINYYKKKEMYDEAIALAEYAIKHSLFLPDGTKDFRSRLEELQKKKTDMLQK